MRGIKQYARPFTEFTRIQIFLDVITANSKGTNGKCKNTAAEVLENDHTARPPSGVVG